jgi:Zn-dependent protease
MESAGMVNEVSAAVYLWSLTIVALALALLILVCVWPLDPGRPARSAFRLVTRKDGHHGR